MPRKWCCCQITWWTDSKCSLEEGVCHFISMKSKNSSFKCLIEATRGLALLFKKIILFLICDFSPKMEKIGDNRNISKSVQQNSQLPTKDIP